MARKKRGGGDDGGGGANWMDTYGDMVTLLMTFFVLLFSMSTVDAEKWEALSQAFSGMGLYTSEGTSIVQPLQAPMNIDQVNNEPIEQSDNLEPMENQNIENYPIPSIEPGDEVVGVEEAREMFEQLKDNLNAAINGNDLYSSVIMDINDAKYTITLRFKENVFFDSGSADIKDDSYELLNNIQLVLAESQQLFSIIRIEGHTDTDPINTYLYPTNWELSSARATNVLRYIIENPPHVIDAFKLTTAAYADTHPIADNSTAEGKALNRRVAFVVEGFRDGEVISIDDPIIPNANSGG